MALIVFNTFLFFLACRNPDKGKIVSVIKDFSDMYAGVPKNYTGEVTFVMLNIVLMFVIIIIIIIILYLITIISYVNYDNYDPTGCDPKELPGCSSRETCSK